MDQKTSDLLSALDSLSPAGLTYQEWCTVGMGLKEAGLPCSVWEEWSARDGGRYHKGECERKWASFKGSARPVTENSIFALARAHGWAGSPNSAGQALDWGTSWPCPPGPPGWWWTPTGWRCPSSSCPTAGTPPAS